MPVVMRLLAEAGAVVDIVHPVTCPVDCSTVRVEHDLYVFKKKSGLSLSLAGALDALGAAFVNPYPASVALRDKIVTTRRLQAAGVPVPATYVVSHPTELGPLLDGGPLIVKPYQGRCGVGIRVVRTAPELSSIPSGAEPVLAQRYHPPDGPDLKLYAIGERIFGVKKIFPRTTEADRHGEPFTPSPELCDIARRCGQAFGIDLFGVDIIESGGQPYVVDMSSIPGFKGVPDAAVRLAEYLYAAAARLALEQWSIPSIT